MSFDPQFIIKEYSDEIRITDITGIYHSVNNPTGWGGANPGISSVTSIELEVIRPDSTGQLSTDDTFLTLLDPTPTLPNVTGDVFTISPSDLGVDDFKDGKYRFKFTISGTSGSAYEYIFQKEKVFYNELFCCAVKEQAKAKLESCGCAECRDKLFNVNLLMLGLDGVIASDKAGKSNQALSILLDTQKLCDGCITC